MCLELLFPPWSWVDVDSSLSYPVDKVTFIEPEAYHHVNPVVEGQP